MIKEQKKRKTMNLPIRIVKRINEEAYRKWKSSSAIALSIIEENCDYVLSLSALPPVDKTSKDLKTSFRPCLLYTSRCVSEPGMIPYRSA